LNLVDRVNVVTYRDTGKPKGFGFVEMANDGEGDKAIATLNGQELDGRALTLTNPAPSQKAVWVAAETRVIAVAAVVGRGNGGGSGRRY
jgi:hypothetical protein